MFWLKLFLVPYFITIVIELIFALIWGVRKGKEVLAVILINTLTNPLVTLVRYLSNQYVFRADLRLWILVIAELMVLLGEWLLFRKFIKRVKHPFLMSLTLNAASFAAGYLSPYIFILLAKI